MTDDGLTVPELPDANPAASVAMGDRCFVTGRPIDPGYEATERDYELSRKILDYGGDAPGLRIMQRVALTSATHVPWLLPKPLVGSVLNAAAKRGIANEEWLTEAIESKLHTEGWVPMDDEPPETIS